MPSTVLRSSASFCCCLSSSPIFRPRPFAAQPRCVSRIWPTFMREGTPSGLSTISTGVPSGRYGMCSFGRMRRVTPFLPARQVRHVLFRQDARDDALVAVTAGHLVADRQLALHRHVRLHQLDHARRQLVAATNLLLLLLELVADDLDLALGALLELAQILLEPRVVGVHLEPD